jgi:hypothetical protein
MLADRDEHGWRTVQRMKAAIGVRSIPRGGQQWWCMPWQMKTAAEWLAMMLKRKPVAIGEIRDVSRGMGFGWRTVQNAKAKLGVRTIHRNGRWLWALN